MSSRKHYRVAKQEAEVKNVKRLVRREKKGILVVVFIVFAIVWLEGFVIGNLIGKKAGTKITCV